jgi:5-methylcytosine-specific restriction protein A
VKSIKFISRINQSQLLSDNLNKLDEQHQRKQITKETKQTILKDQNNQCKKCNKIISSKNCQYDHIIPLASGGEDEIENLQALCIPCHFEKTKNEQENGEYYTLPVYGSVFNNRVINEVIQTENFKRFAFIERLDQPAKKHKSFYVDINNAEEILCFT